MRAERAARAGLSVGGMHPMEALSLYNGDGFAEPEVAARKARLDAERRRRSLGVRPFAASEMRTQNPPCKTCEFASVCRDRQMACNIFAEWTVSRREIPTGIKKLLPSKRWMKLLSETSDLGPIRVAYYSVINKQESNE